MTEALEETPLASLLRSHGACIGVRHGRFVATDFGSVVTETAVCLHSVGLTDRFGRTTLGLRGKRDRVDVALDRVGVADGAARAVRLGPQRAVVRCDGFERGRYQAALDDDDVHVADLTAEQCALGLVGPRALDALERAQLEAVPFPVTVVPDVDGVEVLVPRLRGATMWMRLLSCGRPAGIACVGFDAVEHLAVARSHRRRRDSVSRPDGQML